MIFTRVHLTKVFRLVFVFLMMAGLLLAACGDDDESTPEPTEKPVVRLGLAVSTLDNPFFVSLRDGAQAAADRLEVTLVVEDAQDDTDLQAEQIGRMVDDGVSALLINPVNGETIVPAIEKANAAGIPVFTIDRSAAGGVVVSHIASDNFAGGKMAGEYLAESLSGAGNVIELEGVEGTSAAEQRGAGFNEAIAGYDGIEVIAREVANFNRDEGHDVFVKMLEEYDDIDGVFAHNDEMILGAVLAAQEAGREGILFVGFDAVEDAVTAVENGEILATIAQQPAEMGRLGVETAVDYVGGKTVPDAIPVDLALIAK